MKNIYEAIASSTLASNIVTVIVIALAVATLILAARRRGMEGLRQTMYDLFLRAENELRTETGKAKMDFVIEKFMALMPVWLRLIITKAAVEAALQIAYTQIKDLLDDGRFNGSVVTPSMDEEDAPLEGFEKTEE